MALDANRVSKIIEHAGGPKGPPALLSKENSEQAKYQENS